MAAVAVTISGMLYDRVARTRQSVVLIGEANLTDVGIGGGPIVPGEPPPGFWGPTDPRPTPPIALPPGYPNPPPEGGNKPPPETGGWGYVSDPGYGWAYYPGPDEARPK